MDPMLSIVIPTFNSEKYIIDLLQSINSNFKEIKVEVILIDDGSSDGTVKLEKDFSFNSNISKRIIKTVHSGASHARNVGIKNSTGQYIIFCDSDDVIISSIEKYLDTESAQIISINEKVSFSNNEEIYGNDIDKEKILISMLLGSDSEFLPSEYSMGPYKKLFDRRFLIQNNILFPENYNWWEDLLFNVKAIIRAKSIGFINLDYYRQRYNPSSISHNINHNCLKNAIMVLNDTNKCLRDFNSKYSERVMDQLKVFLLWSVFTGYLVFHPNKQEYKYLVENIPFKRRLGTIAPNLQAKLLINSLRTLGFYPTVMWYGTIKKLKNGLEKKNEK